LASLSNQPHFAESILSGNKKPGVTTHDNEKQVNGNETAVEYGSLQERGSRAVRYLLETTANAAVTDYPGRH